LSFLAADGVAATTNPLEHRPTIGWVENVRLDDADVIMKARIDTGAGLASINANVIDLHKNSNGAERITFQVISKDFKKQTLERNVVQWININKKAILRYSASGCQIGFLFRRKKDRGPRQFGRSPRVSLPNADRSKCFESWGLHN